MAKKNLQKKKVERVPHLVRVKDAMERARVRAMEIAYQTGTPFVIYKDGKVQRLKVVRKKGGALSLGEAEVSP